MVLCGIRRHAMPWAEIVSGTAVIRSCRARPVSVFPLGIVNDGHYLRVLARMCHGPKASR
jgi:hypothetical protein